MSDKIDSKKMLKHALVNAVQYEGKAKGSAVLGKMLAGNPTLKSDIKGTMDVIKDVVKEVNSMSLKEQKDKMDELGIELESKSGEDDYSLPELPNVEGNVIMRMAPYPSGPLHIGNARMVILNDEYVKRYNGKLILVYDDTIGSEEKGLIEDGYKLIKEGLDWLGVTVHKEYYKSDRMEIFYKYAEKMIEEGWAYVCLCTADELREKREKGEECEHRKQTVKTNMRLWKDMLEGKFEEGTAIVRLKTDMKYPDPAFRDRVLLRVCNRNHIRVGDKYHVWPMLEFSWAIDDHELGMTHILRGKDLIIEDDMEKFIWDKFGWDYAEFLHYGILKLDEAKLSKSRARVAIEKGTLKGWDDPRTWSLQSLRKRGLMPDAIRIFIKRMGMSLSDVTVPAEILYAENRKLIDAGAKR
ncbi:MAG: glutamate--tRNA ligase, partial [Candidatus Hodarchaeales archaeon]